MHTGVKPYHCELCDSAFTRKSALIKHVRKKHSGERMNEKIVRTPDYTVISEEKVFRCTKCEKSFIAQQALKRHFSLVHTNKTSNPRSDKIYANSNVQSEASLSAPSVNKH